ncbi:MAG: Long-chain-fatty-acid--CoA ligase [Gammaproteobacteria bacterium]|nr:Long-chain-fatty-acid--CoA ligase [Gammaproteobacteria bacterium]
MQETLPERLRDDIVAFSTVTLESGVEFAIYSWNIHVTGLSSMTVARNSFETDLPKTYANYTALSPISLLRRTASVYPQQTAVIYGERRYTWGQTYERCRRLAAALGEQGIGEGDTVSILAPNIPPLLEAHFAVPMTGGVLNAINVRLDPASVRFQLQHSGAKVFIVDRDLAATALTALDGLEQPPVLVEIDDPRAEEGRFHELRYEDLLEKADPNFPCSPPEDEWQAISLNYTSGTTGDPKGVVYHHRGAYLNTISNALSWNMGLHPIYLWTLPMFHCNGWCFPWTVTAMAGTHVCLRKVDAPSIFNLIAAHDVTHMCGAPIVLNMLLNNAEARLAKPVRTVEVATGGAPPPESVIAGMRELGMRVTHLYGLTETYGPSMVCARHEDWDAHPDAEQARIMARQGVNTFMIEDYRVADGDTGEPVPMDGKTVGEILLRGNTVMKGYLKNQSATQTALDRGWFHSGDLAVWHSDGYVQVTDRAKDIIISGGENISSVEVENALYSHPSIIEAAVVARPDDYWGETPCAFVTLKNGTETSEQDVVDFCRKRLAHFKTPKTVIFDELPKTATGKIQKFALRERARKL